MKGTALCMTVKNEEALIRDNLLYHQYMGIDKVFLYLDKPTDNTAEKVKDLSFVQVSDSVGVEVCDRNLDDWGPIGKKVTEQHKVHHCARQMSNMVDAYDQASEEGFQWLLSLDADELICPQGETSERGSLQTVLSRQDESVDAVRFLPAELVQQRETYETTVFREGTLFKRAHSSDGRRLPTLVEIQKRLVANPNTDTTLRLPVFYGHTTGKSAVRVNRGLFPATVHAFMHPKRQMQANHAFYLLHYMLYSPDDFIKKHQNFVALPNHWVAGAPISPHLRAWIRFVNSPGVTRAEIEQYYRQWITYPQSLLDRYQELEPSPLVEIPEVRRSFERLLGGS